MYLLCIIADAIDVKKSSTCAFSYSVFIYIIADAIDVKKSSTNFEL